MAIKETWGGRAKAKVDAIHCIWADESAWPRDDPQHIFLARAALSAGRALFGETWCGTEPQARVEVALPPLDRRADASVVQILRAAKLLKKHKPKSWATNPPLTEFNLRQLEQLSPTPLNRQRYGGFTAVQWKAVLEVSEKEDEENRTKVDRWEEVQSRLVDKQRSGEIGSFVRNLEGGEFKKIPSHNWNTEAWRSRFEYGLIDESSPFVQPVVRSVSKYLFVSRVDFDRALDSWGQRLPFDDAFLANLSPYMRAALDVARELKISRSNQPLVQDVRDAVRKALESIPNKPRGNTVTNKMVESMATILRTPESGSGKAKKS